MQVYFKILSFYRKHSQSFVKRQSLEAAYKAYLTFATSPFQVTSHPPLHTDIKKMCTKETYGRIFQIIVNDVAFVPIRKLQSKLRFTTTHFFYIFNRRVAQSFEPLFCQKLDSNFTFIARHKTHDDKDADALNNATTFDREF